MSHNCHSTVAKFIAHKVFFKAHNNGYIEDNLMFIDSDQYLEDNRTNYIISSVGWALVQYDCDNDYLTQIKGVKHSDDIISDMWVKDNYIVWLVNESQYSDIAEYSVAVVAETKETLEQFLNDHQLSATIESDDVLQCWY